MSKDLSVVTLLDTYGAMLTDRQRDFVGYYYCEDLSLAEIAENEGVTRQAVRDTIKRSVEQLTEMEQKLGFVKRLEQASSAIELIKAATDGCDKATAQSILALCDTALKQD